MYTLSSDEVREVYQAEDDESIIDMILVGDQIRLTIHEYAADSTVINSNTIAIQTDSILK